MNLSWLQTAGEISLTLYFVLVVGCLLLLVFRAAVRSAAEWPTAAAGRFTRMLIEYFGNTDWKSQRHALPQEIWDRRENPQARFLMDHIRDEMTRRDVTSTEREALIEGLREAMRSEEQGQPS